MAGRFIWTKFDSVDLDDSFFDSLKSDYPEFSDWFKRKQTEEKQALIYYGENGVEAFLYLKRENVEEDNSPIVVNGSELPSIPRLKIGTLRLSENIRKQRLGEDALGVALWYWRLLKYDEVYVTVFENHKDLIDLFERFGFANIGKNDRGECVYIKNRNHLDRNNPYMVFPFILGDFEQAGVIPIDDQFHDKLFPYSELAGGNSQIIEATAGNGITKVFIASPFTDVPYKVDMPVFIYRKHTGSGQATYKSVITSYCTISKITKIKSNGTNIVTLDDFIQKTGNKSVYTDQELRTLYQNKKTLLEIELVYNGYFGKGNNVTHKALRDKKLFNDHPYNIVYSKEQFIEILEMGGVNVQNTIIDQT